MHAAGSSLTQSDAAPSCIKDSYMRVDIYTSVALSTTGVLDNSQLDN